MLAAMPSISAPAWASETPGLSRATGSRKWKSPVGSGAVERERHPHLGRAEKPERGRQDAGHRALFAVHGEIAADRARVAAEFPLPQRVAQQGHARGAGAVVVRHEAAPQRRRHPQQLEEIPGGAHAGDALRPVPAGKVEAGIGDAGQVGETVVLIAPVQEIRARNSVAVSRGLLRPNHDQAAGVPVRQGAEQDAVHHAEHGRVGADAEGQRQSGDGREAGALPHHAKRVTDVLRQVHFVSFDDQTPARAICSR